jgi:hypothetical protein
MPLPATEFLGRFIQHVLPPRFTRVRYYGFLSNRDRTAHIIKARELIGSSRKLRPRAATPDARLCPQCARNSAHALARRPSTTTNMVRFIMTLTASAPPSSWHGARPRQLCYTTARTPISMHPLALPRASPRFQRSSFNCSRYLEGVRCTTLRLPSRFVLSPRRAHCFVQLNSLPHHSLRAHSIHVASAPTLSVTTFVLPDGKRVL